MKDFLHVTAIVALLIFSWGFNTSFVQAQVCSSSFPNGTCPTNQHCQAISLGANNQGEYACVDDTGATGCGRNYPNGCSSGTQCVSIGGGEFTCVAAGSPLLNCTTPDPSNTVQACSCTQYTSGYAWQCTPRTSASSGNYVCREFNSNGQCTNWVDARSNSNTTASNPNCPPGTPAGQLCYTPLEPFPGELGQAQSGTGNFKDLIEGFFKLLINVGAFIAVTVLVIGGITYMVSEATVTKFVAKEKIKAAFWGLAILAGAWLILNTINPQLLIFNKNLVGPASNTPTQGTTGQVPATNNSTRIEQIAKECEAKGWSVDNRPNGPVCVPQ
ncbi:MAG: pilin [Patescibacteria group bacterium]|nr:pilin [Patescibacteria group bacterium]